MSRRRFGLCALLLGLLGLVGTALVCVSFGALRLPLACVALMPLHGLGLEAPACPDAALVRAVLMLRLPRVLLGGAVGAGLGLAGAVLQGLFRNPLVDPGLIGVSSGAALAAAAVLVLGGTAANTPLVLTAAAFAGGLMAAMSVQRLAQVSGRTLVVWLLLAGIAINAVAGALIGALSFLASDAQLRGLMFWSLGSLGGATWERALWALAVLGLSLLPLLRLSGPLNVLSLGESEAAYLGIAVEPLKRRALWLSVFLVASAVAMCGVIGFIGLVVPHAVRLLSGPDQRSVLPGSALLGAGLLLWADLLSRVAVAPAELPLGVVTASLGGPFFLGLLVRERRGWER